jgi:hypothetical protein
MFLKYIDLPYSLAIDSGIKPEIWTDLKEKS